MGAPYIKAEGFGFSIPTGATIIGVQVDVIGKASATASISMSPAQSKIIKAGTATGTAASNATTWTTSPATYSMGGSSSLWGTTLAPADVNASNFGVQVAVFNSGGATVTASIDYVQMTVTYTAAGVNFAGATCTSICRGDRDALERNSMRRPVICDTSNSFSSAPRGERTLVPLTFRVFVVALGVYGVLWPTVDALGCATIVALVTLVMPSL